MDRYADGENAGYPTLCKGRFDVADENYYAIEEPTSLNTLELLPKLMQMGVRAFKIEGRSEEHTSELQSLMRISYAVFCLKKKIKHTLILHNRKHTHLNKNTFTKN